MKLVEPKIALVAETKLDHDEIDKYLEDIDAEEFEFDREVSDAENLLILGGKLCYKSFRQDINKLWY